jgi:hypothetical protein
MSKKLKNIEASVDCGVRLCLFPTLFIENFSTPRPVAGKNLQLPIDPPPPGGWGGNPANAKKFPTDPKSHPSRTIWKRVKMLCFNDKSRKSGVRWGKFSRKCRKQGE